MNTSQFSIANHLYTIMKYLPCSIPLSQEVIHPVGYCIQAMLLKVSHLVYQKNCQQQPHAKSQCLYLSHFISSHRHPVISHYIYKKRDDYSAIRQFEKEACTQHLLENPNIYKELSGIMTTQLFIYNFIHPRGSWKYTPWLEELSSII